MKCNQKVYDVSVAEMGKNAHAYEKALIDEL